MSTARTAILARVLAAQRTAVLPRSDLVLSERPGTDVLDRDRSHEKEDLTLEFARELKALGVEVVHTETPDAVREAVRERTQGLRVLAWDREALPYDVFDMLGSVLGGDSPREQQALAQIGVTGCDAAVAETGSLVLLSGPGRSRAVSLLAPVHLAIVNRGDIVAALADAFVRLDERLRTAASCTVITGPSRTADIELTLTLGIHGPGRVIVVIGP